MNKRAKKINIEKTDAIIFITIITILTISLLSFFPGLLTSDIVDQIGQAKMNSYRDAHPIFHSFVIGNLAKLGGIWVPELFQIIIFALIWTFICKKIRKYNSSTKNKLFQIIVTFIICIIPLNFIYSIILWKDILYSYAILALMGFLYIGIKEKFRFTNLEIIGMSISLASIMKFRHNGVPIGIIMFLIIIITNVIYNRDKKQFILILSSFILTLILMTIPKWIWGQKSNDNMVGGVLDSTKVYCMGALLNSDINLEQDEIDFLNKIYDLEKWKTNFDPYNGTPILFDKSYNAKILQTEEGKTRFNEIFAKYSKQNPKIVIKHFINVNSIWWSIDEKGGMHSIILSNDYLSESTNGIYDNHPKLNKMNEFLIKYSVKTLENKYIYRLLYRPATAIIVSSLAIIVISIKKKNIWYFILLFPMCLNIGTYIFVMSSQDQRYFYPCFMTEYISVLILAEMFFKNSITHNKKNNECNKNNTKTLVIIPAYNESKSIKNVIENVYSQNIENCDVIVINDGSTDDTYKMAKKTKAIVIDSPNNLGIGGAVQTGYIYAYKNNYDIAIQLDGDGQHNPKYIKDFIEEIKKGNDIVIGSRFIEKTGYNQTFSRMLGIKIISFAIKAMTGKKIYDTTSGFRAVNKNIIEEFTEEYPYDYPEPCTNMAMIKKGYRIKEIPVKMKYRETGVSSISSLKGIMYMFKVTMSIILMGIKK